jgi:type I restriction enzyme S subunit
MATSKSQSSDNSEAAVRRSRDGEYQGAGMKEGWQTKKLGDLCEVFADGDWVESKDQSSEGIRLIQTGNVGQGIFKDRAEKARYISEATFKRLRCTEIFEGDCLISRLPDPAGRSCILPDTGERMITAVDCTIIRFNPKHVMPEFFNYYTQSRDYLKDVDSETTGTTRKRISRSKLGEVQIPVPPLAEQQRIVGILDEAFDAIAIAKGNAENNLQNARALFESHLQSVFTQRVEGWVEKTLGGACTFSSGGTPSKSNSAYWKGAIPWVSGRDMKKDRIGDAALHISRVAVDESATRIAPIGSLLILVRGMGLANGFPIAEVVSPCAFNQDIRAIHPGSDIDPRFLLFSLQCTLSQSDHILNNAAHGTLKIDMDDLRSVPVSIPSLDNQKNIVSRIDALSSETRRLESIYPQKLAALEALKKSLLHQAFAGEL